jgi:hypothetical protein
MYRILSGFAAIVMTAGTVAFATPAQAAPAAAVACQKAVTAAH